MSTPPRRPIPLAGETWFIQRTRGNPLLTAQVDEVTARTVLLRWVEDGGLSVKFNAAALRFRLSELSFVEKVA